MGLNSKVIAYIDGANLHKGVKDLGWPLDYQRFRVWLRDKYQAGAAYIFIGLVPRNKDLYTRLQEHYTSPPLSKQKLWITLSLYKYKFSDLVKHPP